MDHPPASPEEVLSQAFDRLSHSHSPSSMEIGLKAIDAYLAIVCSTPVPIVSPANHPLSIPPPPPSFRGERGEGNKLAYPTSPWIKEFRRLQDGFEYNIALRVIGCIDRILLEKKKYSSEQQNSLLAACLECLQGVLLLHPQSQNLFAREAHMATFITLLTHPQPPDLHILTIDTLVTSLLDSPANTRTFESLHGLQTISQLFRTPQTPEKVRLRLTEFLYFYLLPEVEHPRHGGYSSAQVVEVDEERVIMGPRVRSIEQKEELAGRYLKGVEGIVGDIRGFYGVR
ncbi:60S ribosomal protein L3 [Orbilia blumenaviensis]|uniref:60S ribosomal protein L3 n=1 Tax=Orbilia blumenaviensis TaxID=1796055 RepID=A0AAV9U1W4_9PEZI